jgi:xanthine/uracil permease
MIEWIKAGLASRKSTIAGLLAIALAVALLVIPAIMPAEAAALASENVRWLIGALFASGLGGLLWHGQK